MSGNTLLIKFVVRTTVLFLAFSQSGLKLLLQTETEFEGGQFNVHYMM